MFEWFQTNRESKVVGTNKGIPNGGLQQQIQLNPDLTYFKSLNTLFVTSKKFVFTENASNCYGDGSKPDQHPALHFFGGCGMYGVDVDPSIKMHRLFHQATNWIILT